MGRGRAKAKQTKVARALKYYSPNTDLSALENELHASNESPTGNRWSEPVDDDAEDDDYGRWTGARR